MFIYVQDETKPVLLTKDYVCTHAEEIGKLLQRAVREALLMHKRIGNPIAIWRDGKVVIVPPEEIVVPPDVPEPNE